MSVAIPHRFSCRSVRSTLAMILPGILLLACGRGSSPGTVGGGAFVVLKTEPTNNARLLLNQSVKFFFSNPVDLNTATFNSVAFFPRDASGNPVPEQVVGLFRYGRDGDNVVDPRILEFVPKLPTNDTFTNGGFRPARDYLVSLVSASNSQAPALRDKSGRGLSANSPVKALRFQTATGTTARELFLDTSRGGPRVASTVITPLVGDRVSLNTLGGVPVEIALRFDQPLNPQSSNVPVRQSLDPIDFKTRRKGRIYLEYDDPELGKDRWIPADVEMSDNSSLGATVILRPDGVLPNGASVRIIVAAELQDIAGESNVLDSSYSSVHGSFRTEDEYAAEFDAVVLDFETDDLFDPDAPFRDPVARIEDGVLRATFDFDGTDTPFDYEPTSAEIIANTDFVTLTPSNGPPLSFSGGIFRFQNVTIRENVTVRGVGTNPMVWLVNGSMRVNGHLSVDGGDGDQVNTLRSANFPTAGGQGVCTGGNGGKGSVNPAAVTPKGEDGFGSFQRPRGGGTGGRLACTPGEMGRQAAGGGGGSLATRGDPDYFGLTTPPTNGQGGPGTIASGTYAGGAAGPTVFKDADQTNDFWGRNVDATGKVVVGELKAPLGGGGGGGGGDRTFGTPAAPCAPTAFINDAKGGGGGGGAGVLVVKALGKIFIGATGRITADGGRGGGGQSAGSCLEGGGGGGGAGGMVVLMSGVGIEIQAHGGTWANGDAAFAISADGSFGRNTGFGGNGNRRLQKYPNVTEAAPNAGGFGGMGIVQLMVPAGSLDADKTKTVRDDNIRILDSFGKPLQGAAKVARLVRGDIRPDPTYVDPPFGRSSRYETRWLAMGATVRRIVAGLSGVRATTSLPLNYEKGKDKDYGPDYRFAGLVPSGPAAGYVATNPKTGRLVHEVLSFGGRSRWPVASVATGSASVRGEAVHTVRVSGAPLPTDQSLTGLRARLLDASGTDLGDWRILGHSASELFLRVADGALQTSVARVEVIRKLFEVVTDGNEGLGEVHDGTAVPVANVQFGFAFHRDPSNPKISNGLDENRFPRALRGFTHDLQDTSAMGDRTRIRRLHYPFVKLFVRFNLNYNPKDPDQPGATPVGPATPRTGLRFVVLPTVY